VSDDVAVGVDVEALVEVGKARTARWPRKRRWMS
jgi:hypothetical protein